MNNPFDYKPDAECEKAFKELVCRLETLKESCNPEDISFCRELEEGKMLGVLVAADIDGVQHSLYAFSGQIGKGGFHYPGFVDPVFDYLQPDGYFKLKEREISRQNEEISLFEKGELAEMRRAYEFAEQGLNDKVKAFKERCRLSKINRDRKRESGMVDDAESAAMIRQSQFEKAELHRMKSRVAVQLEPLRKKLKYAETHLEELKEQRRRDSEDLQRWLFDNFRVLNGKGETGSLSDIFAGTSLKVPPSGAGECCAPKLLQAAYLRKLKPISIAEYWYGKPKGGEVRVHGNHYPACRGKCLPLLSWMLQGLDVDPPLESEINSGSICEPAVIFENSWFCVVNKPSGMLSVPGKGKGISVQQWLEDKYGAERCVKVAHRLDQDTSGLLIATFGNEAFKMMQSMFAKREIKKTYIADLEGNYERLGISTKGKICLALTPDWLDRPRQRVDEVNGKFAETEYRFLGLNNGRSRIVFHPLTGRTHQLRVHAASESGLGMPIVGDRLYGYNSNHGVERLHLHAQKIEFDFPIDGLHYCFESPVPF